MQTQTKIAMPILHPARSGLLQRKCACGGTPGPTGECTVCRRKRLSRPQGLTLQTKLAINQPGDRWEQEADRTADQIMRRPTPSLQRQVRLRTEAAHHGQVQRQARSETSPAVQQKPFCTGDAFLDNSAVRSAIQQAWADTQTCASKQQAEFEASSENIRNAPAAPLEGLRDGGGSVSEIMRETHFRVENNQPTAIKCSEFSEKVVFAESGIGPSTQAFFHTHPASRTVREAERAQDTQAAAENSMPLYIIAEEEVFVLNSPTRRIRWPRAKLAGPCPQAAPEEVEPVARKAISHTPVAVDGQLAAQIEPLRSGGDPLPSAPRQFFESHLGHDFRQVRLHTDRQAAASAQALNALAYTMGNHIVFNAGQYQPQTNSGRRLLAHELTHVLQQQAGAGQNGPHLQRKLMIDEPAAGVDGLSLKTALERLAGRTLERSDKGFTLSTDAAADGSPTTANFIQRAIESAQTYRLRWGASGQPGQPGSVAQKEGETLITIDRAQVGEFTFTLGELAAEQLVAAVTQFDHSTQVAPAATDKMTGQPLADLPADEFLSTPLTMTADNTGEKQGRIRAFVDQKLTHLTPAQRRLVYETGWRAEGVPLAEIIRGIETNTPFRMIQKVEGGRVNTTYVDPRKLPPTADQFDTAAIVALLGGASREVTFLPGADAAAAAPADLPKTGAACTEAERQDAKNSCCAPEALAEFRQHVSTARDAVKRTIKRLQGDELIACQTRKHLGEQGTAAGLAQVVEMLQLAQSELFLSRHGWKCREKGSGQLGCDRRVLDGNEGFVGGKTYQDQTNIIVCVNPDAPFTTWTTILHEVMHRVGVHGVETYQGDSSYPGANPLQNADSYAGLVATMGGSSWSPCNPWPLDVRGILGSNLGRGFVLGARLEATPLGPGLRVVDWTLGVNFLWSPKFGIVPEGGDDPQNVLGRGYLGAETGIRLTLPRKHGALIFDAAAGLGALFPGETSKPDLGLSARVGSRFRFGTGLSGPEVGLELSRLQSLAERERGDWVLGVTAGFHFGRSEKRK